MELWIRSQNKEDLVNSPLRVYYDKNYEEVHQLKANTYDETICLGTYETKERTLEVLNEIQRLIEDLQYISYAIENEKFCAYRPNVYNMPEE